MDQDQQGQTEEKTTVLSLHPDVYAQLESLARDDVEDDPGTEPSIQRTLDILIREEYLFRQAEQE